MDTLGEPITWLCSASGHGRFYQVVVLDRHLLSFELIVYRGERLDLTQPIATLTIQIQENSDRRLLGQSIETAQNETVIVKAFERSLDFEVNHFEVNHSVLGQAIGRCQRNLEWE